MGKMVFLTGGARSGKSAQAQKIAEKYEDVAYLATAVRTDGEMEARIKKHVAARPKSWTTYECPETIAEVIAGSGHEAYLLDCVTVFLTNLLMRYTQEIGEIIPAELQERIEREIMEKMDAVLEAIRKSNADFIVVSNEVGMGLVPPYALGRLFRDIAGRVNQKIAAGAEEVYLVVSGIPVRIKG